MPWLNPHDGFESVSFCNDDLFNRLWLSGRLQTVGLSSGRDWVDEVNARLVNSAFASHESLFIALPDSRCHRGPLMLATALLRFWFSRREQVLSAPHF